jgi:hypothetical protein
MNTDILSRVKEFIGKTFCERGSSESYYHNFTHTAEVVKVTEEDIKEKKVNLLFFGNFHKMS